MATASSISVLHDDLLLYIFNLNTHTPEMESGYGWGLPHNILYISALDTARRTSQVCHQWREVILQSHSIWGNLIDLESLMKASNSWVEEVLNRTGEANLSIYGPVRKKLKSLFSSLLNEQWHRVRRLDVYISQDNLIDKEIWDIFWTCPAPNLEKFLIRVWATPTHGPNHNLPLFAGSAPSLRRIHSSSSFHFDHHDPWVSQLSSLTLSRPFKTVDALNVISRCSTRLESLVIEWTIGNEETDGWTEHIHLPCLSRIDILSSVVTSLVYLSNITPRSDCTLILRVDEKKEDLDMNVLRHLSDVILPYAKNYFSFYRPKKLDILIRAQHVRIDPENKGEKIYFGHPRFGVALETGDAFTALDPVVADVILHTLSSTSFESVSNLKFELTDISKWFPTECASFEVLRSLTSVKEMTLTPWAMETLNRMPDPTHTLFPRLTDITIINQHHPNQDLYIGRILLRFLSRRKKAGKPILTLDVANSFYIHKWGFLGQIEGLKVVYRQEEYVCGQGGSIEAWCEMIDQEMTTRSKVS